MNIQMPLSLKPVWRFAVHVVVGSIAFLIVFFVAMGVGSGIDWATDHGAHPWMVDQARWVEAGIFWLDLFGLVVFLVKETIKLCRHLLLHDWDE